MIEKYKEAVEIIREASTKLGIDPAPALKELDNMPVVFAKNRMSKTLAGVAIMLAYKDLRPVKVAYAVGMTKNALKSALKAYKKAPKGKSLLAHVKEVEDKARERLADIRALLAQLEKGQLDKMPALLLRPKEACAILGISWPTLYKWVKGGLIEAVFLPSGRMRIPLIEVVRIIRGRKKA